LNFRYAASDACAAATSAKPSGTDSRIRMYIFMPPRSLPLRPPKLADEPTQVLFQVRVPVAVAVGVAVGGVLRVEAALQLPLVRHAVAVGVDRRLGAAVRRPRRV